MSRRGQRRATSRARRGTFWRRRAVAVLALVVAAAGVALGVRAIRDTESQGPAPQTLKKAMWGPLTQNGHSLFPIYRDLGVGIFQTAVRWDQLAPTKPADPTDPRDPAYQWPAYVADSIKGAKRHGMEVTVLILGAPRW